MRWYDWIVRSIAVVAVPMVLHGLYDTFLKKEMNALALTVAVCSFLWLAFQISAWRSLKSTGEHLREWRSLKLAGWLTANGGRDKRGRQSI